MSSSDFSEIALKRDRGKQERLFRAAVTAFSSLPRPSRNEVVQLEDLTLPLYDGVSAEARRFVAAVLSEIEQAPAALVRRLAGESVEIAAPVLLRSKALSDVDLIALIGRHGLPHARVIAKRENLNPTIAQLCAALQRRDNRAAEAGTVVIEHPAMRSAVVSPVADRTAADRTQPGQAAEEVRARLRAMMRPSAPEARELPHAGSAYDRPDLYSRLSETALSGVSVFFQTALADALGIELRQTRPIVASSDPADLIAALKFLELSAEQAFVITAALHPALFGHAEAIRLFLRRYRLLHRETAADRARGWKEAALAAVLQAQPRARSTSVHTPANNPGRPVFGKAQRA